MSVVVVGGGPAGLMAAETIAARGRAVTLVDHMPSVGRKLLMAGRGGLNLTHAEPLALLLDRYGAASPVREAVAAFPPQAVVAWCESLGQPVFTGSSGRIFPRAMKASPLLRAWLARLREFGVRIRPGRRFLGLEPGAVRLDDGVTPADAVVLACGGASWPRLGSDGRWVEALPGCDVAALRPANMGVRVAWSETFARRFAGTPLKRVRLSFAGHAVAGEAMVTADGLEGGAVYALSATLREALREGGTPTLAIDLRPDLDDAAIARRLGGPRGGESLANLLRKRLGLSPVAIGLVQEALHAGADRADLAGLIRGVPVTLSGVQGLARAISTAGGLSLDELDGFMLRRHPGVFAAGEMLDWEAPTGGYLLQGCLSTGRAAGLLAAEWAGAA